MSVEAAGFQRIALEFEWNWDRGMDVLGSFVVVVFMVRSLLCGVKLLL